MLFFNRSNSATFRYHRTDDHPLRLHNPREVNANSHHAPYNGAPSLLVFLFHMSTYLPLAQCQHCVHLPLLQILNLSRNQALANLPHDICNDDLWTTPSERMFRVRKKETKFPAPCEYAIFSKRIPRLLFFSEDSLRN